MLPTHPTNHPLQTYIRIQRTVNRLPRDGPRPVAGQKARGLAHIVDGGGTAQGGAGLCFLAQLLFIVVGIDDLSTSIYVGVKGGNEREGWGSLRTMKPVMPRAESVLMGPGLRQLTRMPYGPCMSCGWCRYESQGCDMYHTYLYIYIRPNLRVCVYIYIQTTTTTARTSSAASARQELSREALAAPITL